jgi:predicted transcriptional regulator
MYRLYVLEKVRKGRDDVANGRVINAEDLRNEIQSW